MPHNLLFDLWLEFLNSTIRGAKITIDGVIHHKPIFKTAVEGTVIKKYIYLDVEQGKVSRAALIDRNEREVDAEEMNIEKTADGQMIVFFYEFDLVKRGVNVG